MSLNGITAPVPVEIITFLISSSDLNSPIVLTCNLLFPCEMLPDGKFKFSAANACANCGAVKPYPSILSGFNVICISFSSPPERLTADTPSILSKRFTIFSSNKSFNCAKSKLSLVIPTYIGCALISIFNTIGSFASSGKEPFIISIFSLISIAAISISVPS